MPGSIKFVPLFYSTVFGSRNGRSNLTQPGSHPNLQRQDICVHRDLVVVGASAGGIEALQQIIRGLPADFDAAVLIVLHTSGRSTSLLPQILGRATRLPVSHPEDRTPIQKGHIYVAPPDRHMLIEDSHVRVLHGPRENLHRPAIDPLFRSAAVTAGRRAIGVVLSGLLDDGTSGLMVLRAHGGAAIVQDPQTALFSPMPQHALEQVQDAQMLPVEAISAELVRLVREGLPEEIEPRHSAESVEEKETRFLEREMPQMENGERPGHPSAFACPDCGGVLWELEENGFLRYRCRVGHAFTARHLSAEQRHAIETALWSALRALEESAALYYRLAEKSVQGSRVATASRFRDRAENSEQNAKVLREFLVHVDAGEE